MSKILGPVSANAEPDIVHGLTESEPERAERRRLHCRRLHYNGDGTFTLDGRTIDLRGRVAL